MKKNQIFSKEKNKTASNFSRDYSREVVSQRFKLDQGSVPLLQEDLHAHDFNEIRKDDSEYQNRETTSVSLDSSGSLNDHHDFPSNYSPYYEYTGLAQEQRMRSFRVFEGKNIMRDIQERQNPSTIVETNQEIFSKTDSSLNRLSDSKKFKDRHEVFPSYFLKRTQKQKRCICCVNRNSKYEFKGNRIRTSKYTLLTFLPKNLLEQFSQLANIYFLFIAVLQMIKPISISNGKPMELLPLAFIVANLRKVERFDVETQVFQTCCWQDIRVGDVVLVKEGQGIPADMMLVKTSSKQRMCYLETRNLDGETNLKERKADKLLSSKVSVKSPQSMLNLAGKITCDESNEKLFKFEGAYYFESFKRRIALNTESLLLRGCILRNTKHVIGIVVYTGHDTKIFRNQQNSRFKMSSIQKGTNKQIILVFIIQMLLCLFASGYNTIWFSVSDKNLFWWLEKDVEGTTLNYASQFFISLGTWLLIFTNFIPISLLVTLEFVKFFQAAFMQWEIEMFDQEQDIKASVQASNLNEELGQVEYIFSDKTGTMTCNVMQFRKFSAGPISYGQLKKVEKERDRHFNFKDQTFDDAWQTQGENYQYIKEVLIHMAVCHTVVWDSQLRRYNGSSPDEVALVNAAQRLQVEFLNRDTETNTISILFKGTKMTFKLLQVLEFSSARQRMSIIVKDNEGQIIMFTKGADSVIMPRIDEKVRNYKDITIQYLNQYAREGFRTLVLCKKLLDQEEYEQWFNRVYQVAQQRDVDREKALELAYDEIEQRLCVIGCTAIEDKLQEKVDETIKFMREAGIKVWVLTGDKVETAINIGQSSGLLDLKKMKIFQMTEGNFEDNFRCLTKLEGQIQAYERMESSKKGQYKTAQNNEDAQIRNSQINYTHQQTNRDSETSSGSSNKDDVYEFDPQGQEEDLEFNQERKRSKQVNQTNNSSKYLFKGFTKNLDDNWDAATRQSKLGNPSRVKKLALVINGEALAFINGREEGREKLLEVVDKISVVLACRVTPKQKSEIVLMIRKRFPNKVTLSIGDGANDVNMITTAHVGVGIAGLEGQQAARCADFVIGQFRFLKPLLFIHGREAYRRNSYLVCYNFYKNAVFVLVIFWYGALSAFSGQTIYESFIYQLFNIVFTSVPIMYYSVFIFQHEKTYYLEHPETYILGLQHRCFGTKIFWQWIIYGGFQAVMILAISYFHIWPSSNQAIFPVQNEMISFSPENFGMYDVWTYGLLVYFLVVIVVNLRIIFSYHIYTKWGELLIFISILSFYLTVLVYSQIKILQNDVYHLLSLFFDVNVWFKVFFAIFAFPVIDQIAGLTVGLIRDNNRPEYMGIEEFSNLSDPYLTRRQFRGSAIFNSRGVSRRTTVAIKQERTAEQQNRELKNTKVQFSGSDDIPQGVEDSFTQIQKERTDSRDLKGFESWRQGAEPNEQERLRQGMQRQAQSEDYGIFQRFQIRNQEMDEEFKHDTSKMEVENDNRDKFQQQILEQTEFNQQQREAITFNQEEDKRNLLKKKEAKFKKTGNQNVRYQNQRDEDEANSLVDYPRHQNTARANTILNSSEISNTKHAEGENQKFEQLPTKYRAQNHKTMRSQIKAELTLTQSNLAPSSRNQESEKAITISQISQSTSPRNQRLNNNQQAILMDLEDDLDDARSNFLSQQELNLRRSSDSSRD